MDWSNIGNSPLLFYGQKLHLGQYKVNPYSQYITILEDYELGHPMDVSVSAGRRNRLSRSWQLRWHSYSYKGCTIIMGVAAVSNFLTLTHMMDVILSFYSSDVK